MTVATLKDVLTSAIAGNFAVAGVVVQGWEDASAYVAAAEAAHAPIILQAGPGARKHMPVAILGKIFRTLADKASVPVVCHIDHAHRFDECREAVDHGFSSIMIDGSMLPLSENIALTTKVVEMAKSFGVSVEGEIGVVGYADGAASAFTSASEAAEFERRTGIDALAISVGNVHLQTSKMAQIDFASLRAIEAVTHAPLVLHGGSGISSVDRRQLAATSRVKKFNIGTELRMGFGAALRLYLAQHPEEFDRNKILAATIPSLRQDAQRIIEELARPV